MLVKNIIKKSAELLNLKNIVDYLNEEIDIDDEINEDIKNLLISVNMVNYNLATNYIELIGTGTGFTSISKGIIPYANITSKTIIEIKKVTTSAGENINFKILPEGIDIGDYGSASIEYSYFPDEVTISDSINHYIKINELIFALGVVGEYLYIKGAIDEASIWNNKFNQIMSNLLRPKRSVNIPTTQRWE